MLIYYQLSSAEITVPFSCFLFSSHLLLTNPHCYVISKTKLIVKNDSNSFFRIYHDGKRCAFSEKCVLNKADREGGWNNFFKYAAYLACALFFCSNSLRTSLNRLGFAPSHPQVLKQKLKLTRRIFAKLSLDGATVPSVLCF